MRITRSIWLLVLLSSVPACAFHQKGNQANRNVFSYYDSNAKKAVFDLDRKTIVLTDRVIHFSDCSDAQVICLESAEAKIVVPRFCNSDDAFNHYISKQDGLEFIGSEGLSGNIFKKFIPTDKFAYAYHFTNGVVQLVIIPESSSKRITKDKSLIPNYTYRISHLKGPLACATRHSE